MENNKYTFEEMADNAEQTLKKTEEGIRVAMSGLDKEKYEELTDSFLQEKVFAVIDILENQMPDFSNEDWEHIILKCESLFYPILKNFPPCLGSVCVEKIFSHKEWQEVNANSKNMGLIVSSLYSSLGKAQEKKEEEMNYSGKKPMTPATLSFSLSRDDFTVFPRNIGAYLPKNVSLIVKGDSNGKSAGCFLRGGNLVMEGNVSSNVGYEMKDGIITVKGDAGNGAGFHMKGGKITIEGDVAHHSGQDMRGGMLQVKGRAGKKTGKGMTGGTLHIVGEVDTFDWSVFFPRNDGIVAGNQGVVIWKEITIWDNGWTKIGKEMKNRNEIPIEE